MGACSKFCCNFLSNCFCKYAKTIVHGTYFPCRAARHARMSCVVDFCINYIDLTFINPIPLYEGLLERFFVVFRSATFPDKAQRLLEMDPTTA